MSIAELSWRSAASDLGRTIARSERPLTFLLGAGASLSSGGPTTADVTTAFENATRGRFDRANMLQQLHLIPEPEKQDVLAPFFRDVVPYIGYRCLAALGRHRRVNLLNLNWDNAAAAACSELGVPSVSFDLCDRQERAVLRDFPEGFGVVIAHVHGRLGRQCRFETLRTLKFGEAEVRFLRRNFLANTLVIAGASIVNDSDLQALFLGEREDTHGHGNSHAAQWYFGRTDVSPQLDAMRRSQLPHGVPNYFSADDVDFDELMVRLLGPVLNADWDLLREYQPSLGLPSLDELVWPEPALLRSALSCSAVALLGQPRLGKSVIAHLLAYLRALWASREPWSKMDLPVRAVDGPADSVAALSGIIPGERRSYVVENPFGSSTRTESNLAFIEALRRFASMPDRKSVVIMTSRLGAWPDNSGDSDTLPVVKSATAPDQWFSVSALRAYVRRRAPTRQDVIDSIETHGIRTPARVIDAISGVQAGDSDLPDDVAETADKASLLRANEPLAWLCCILRLQEFCAEMLPAREIDAWLGSGVAALPFRDLVSHKFQFEGIDRLRLKHDTDREATDIYISANRDAVHDRLRLGPGGGRQMLAAFTAWELIAAASEDNWIPAVNAPSAAVRQFAPELVSVATGGARPLELLSALDYDAWDIKDLSYEFVRVWDRLGTSAPGRALLSRILSDRAACGTYAVLEACLYMQSAVPDELWRKVYASLDDLLVQPDAERELALAVDALTWRPPPEQHRQPSWARKFLQLTHRSDPRWALVRFLKGYHGGGLGHLDMDELVREDSTRGWDEAQAEFGAWLVRWHFIHQSRSRAQMARQPWVDKDFLCRSLHPEPKEQSNEAVNRLLQSFLEFPEKAGWGFFLGCNLPAIGHGVNAKGKELTQRALRIATPCSEGVIAAALTYETSSDYAVDLQRFFASDESQSALLDAMCNGLTVDGIRLSPPRFIVNRNPVLCHSDVGLRWGNLRHSLAQEQSLTPEGKFDLSTLVARLRSRVNGLPMTQRTYAEDVIRLTEAGDFRLLDAAAAARSPPRASATRPLGLDIYGQLLNRAASLLAADQQAVP